MRRVLWGGLGMLVVVLALAVCYIGLITFIILPGETKQAGAFTIQRDVYLDTQYGRMTPVTIESDTAITYTITIRK